MSEILRKFGEFTISTSISWLNPLGPGHPKHPVSIEHLKVDPVGRSLTARVRNLNDLHLLTKIRLVTLFDDPVDPVDAHRRTPKLRILDERSRSQVLPRFEEETSNSGSVVLAPRGASEVAIRFGESFDPTVAIRLCLQMAAMPASKPTKYVEPAGGAQA